MGRNSGEDGPEQMNSEPCGVASSPSSRQRPTKSLGTIKFDGTDQKGNNITANGIEQCKYNPQDKKFYLNIPATLVTTGTTTSAGPGLVLTISEHAPFHVERVFTIDPVATGCAGPSGLAVGPSNQMALGCGGTNSLVINSTNGKVAVQYRVRSAPTKPGTIPRPISITSPARRPACSASRMLGLRRLPLLPMIPRPQSALIRSRPT
jgi:hypothetical protein